MDLPEIVQKFTADVTNYVAKTKEAANGLMYFGKAAGQSKSTLDLLKGSLSDISVNVSAFAKALNQVTPSQVRQFNETAAALDNVRRAAQALVNVRLQPLNKGGGQGDILSILDALSGKGVRGIGTASDLEARLNWLVQLNQKLRSQGLPEKDIGLMPEGFFGSRLYSKQLERNLAVRLSALGPGAKPSDWMSRMAGQIGLQPIDPYGYRTPMGQFVGPMKDAAFSRRAAASAMLDDMLRAQGGGGGIRQPPSIFGGGVPGGYAFGRAGAGLAGGIGATGLPGSGMASTLLGGLAIGGIGGLVGGGLSVAGQMLGNVVSTISSVISQATSMVAGAVSNMVKSIVEGGAELEKWRITFGTLMGDAERGNRAVAALQEMTTQTPYSFQQLAHAEQTLLGMGVKAENLVAIMSRLGDVASGDAGRLQRLAVVFGEVEAEGKLTGWRIRQLASLGIGIADMARTMGVPTETFRGLVGANLVPGDILTKTLVTLTDKGGRFGELNKALLQSASAQWDRLGNTVGVVASKMGEAFLKSSGVAKFLAGIADDVQSTTERLVVFAKGAGEALGNLLKEVGPLGRGALGAFAAMFNNTSFGDRILNLIPGLRGLSESAAGFGEVFIRVAGVVGTAVAKIIETIGKLVSVSIRIMHVMVNSPAAPKWLEPALTAVFGTKTGDEALDKLEFQILGPALGMAASAPGDWKRFVGGWRGQYAAQGLAGMGKGAMSALGFNFGGVAGPNRTIFPNPFSLSGAAQEVFSQLEVQAFGGKDKSGAAGKFGVLDEYQRQIKALNELETKSKQSGMARFLLGGLARGLPALGGLLNMFGGQNVERRGLVDIITQNPNISGALGGAGALAGALFRQVPDLTLPKGATDKQRYEWFEKLRDTVGGKISDQLPPAALYGSAEAYDTIAKTQSDNTDTLSEVLSVLQAGKDIQEQLKDEAVKVNDVLRNLQQQGVI